VSQLRVVNVCSGEVAGLGGNGLELAWRLACKDVPCGPAASQQSGIDVSSSLPADPDPRGGGGGESDSDKGGRNSSLSGLSIQKAMEPDFCYKDGKL
jgi:hypothetical protein